MHVTLQSGVQVRHAGEETILLSAGVNAAYWRINGTARMMLDRLLDGKSVAEVALYVTSVTDADSGVVRHDVEQLVQGLAAAGLVQLVSPHG